MSSYIAAVSAAVVGLVIATAAFYRPERVFRRSATAVVFAVALPYVVAFAAGPFLGDGAGMGVAFILYALSALIVLVAVCASLGAAVRYMWMTGRDG